MPDITMCKGEGCPYRERCYRATATPLDHRQSYFVTPPVRLRWVGSVQSLWCDHHMPIAESEDDHAR